jgi:cysteine-rich repeat protein
MPTQQNYRHYRSLRATGRAALTALIATCATACIFIGEIDVDGDSAPADDMTEPHGPYTHDDGPCGETQPEHEHRPDGASTTGEVDETGDPEPTPTEAFDDLPSDLCGNAEIDLAEACDDGVNDGAHGGCMPGCGALAPYCGDGQTNGPESCDDANLVDDDGCTRFCQRPRCGDGLLQPGEQCDGAELSDATCASLGFAGGQLACDSAACTFDVQPCFACGDGQLDPDEACDGAELGDATCESLGFAGGQLACDATCGLDTGGCDPTSVPVDGCCLVGDPGSCSLGDVQACVCAQEPGCCELAWSELCVAVAIGTCFAQCP